MNLGVWPWENIIFHDNALLNFQNNFFMVQRRNWSRLNFHKSKDLFNYQIKKKVLSSLNMLL